MGEQGGGDDESKGFRASAIGQLEKELHIEFSEQLKQELCDLADKYRNLAKSVPSKLTNAPSNLDLSKQIQWFEDNTIKPAQTLLKALTTDRHLMRTVLSPDLDSYIDIEHLLPALEKLLDDADLVYVDLDQQMAHRITNKEQIQYEVASSLHKIFDQYLGDDFTKRGTATMDQVLRTACGEVLDHKEQMNSVLKAVRLQTSKR
jgi:hypothetical protein